MEHKLKLNHRYWDDVESGKKAVEFRINDRDYKVGDNIIFYKVDDSGKYINGCEFGINATITYFFQDEKYLQKDYCALVIEISKENAIEKLSTTDLNEIMDRFSADVKTLVEIIKFITKYS